MGARTKIEWCDTTWNPVIGCSKVSAGCTNCYAERLSHRFGWTTKTWNATYAAENVRLHPERLEDPLRWRKPRRVFVNSMSDLFHPDVPPDFLDRVFAVMSLASHHTFMILTKRQERMQEYITYRAAKKFSHIKHVVWPLPNVWLGVSIENQKAADERVPLLLQTPAAVRFVSCEPLLGPVDLCGVTLEEWDDGGIYVDALTGERWMMDGFERELEQLPRIDWVIVGGESGPGARPMNPDWVTSLQHQCELAKVPFFFKQWGEWSPYYGYEDDDCPCGRGCEEVCDRVHFWGFSGGGPAGYEPRGIVCSVRVGKKKAGRLLWGREWNEIPEWDG